MNIKDIVPVHHTFTKDHKVDIIVGDSVELPKWLDLGYARMFQILTIFWHLFHTPKSMHKCWNEHGWGTRGKTENFILS